MIPVPSTPAAPQASSTDSSAAVSNEKGRLLELAQAHRWGKPVFRERERGGPPHAPIFTIEVVMTIEGTPYTTTGTGTTKIQAEHEAARRLREHLPHSEGKRVVAATGTDKRAVSLLSEMVQKKAITSVRYTCQQSGPSHEPTFLCTCIVITPDGKEVVTTAVGKTKKVATHHAAEQAIASLLPSSHG